VNTRRGGQPSRSARLRAFEKDLVVRERNRILAVVLPVDEGVVW
jgi:hypothetical protein